MAKLHDVIAIVYGEIYNHHSVCTELGYGHSSSAAGSIGTLVMREGFDVLGRLNGRFSAALYARDTETLYVISDRYGSKRFYYCFRDGLFCAFPALTYFSHFGIRPVLNLGFVLQFLTFRYIVDGSTLYKEVSLIPHGTVLEVGQDYHRFHQYWDWAFEERSPLEDEKELVQAMDSIWIKAVERRVTGKARIAIPLSGGLDSRAILGAALECKAASEIITFTAGTPGTFDYEIGRRVAHAVGVQNVPMDHTRPKDYEEEYRLQCLDSDGLTDPVFQFFLSDWERISSYSTDVLTGFMGDPLTGSHLTRAMMSHRVDDESDLAAAKMLVFDRNKLISPEAVATILGIPEQVYESLMWPLISQSLRSNAHQMLPNFCDYWDFVYRQRCYSALCVFNRERSFNYLVPFLDNDFVDLALHASPKLRIEQTWYKGFLSTRFPELYSLPTKNLDGLPLVTRGFGRCWLVPIDSVIECLSRLPVRSARCLVHRLQAFPSLLARRQYRPSPDLCRKAKLGVNYADFSLWLRGGNELWMKTCTKALSNATEGQIVSREAVARLMLQHRQGDDSPLYSLILIASLGWILDCYNPRTTFRAHQVDPLPEFGEQ
jgi:hypothetical protein